jgi:hypothetical protein
MEMSLWGLGYYAKVFGDTLVDREVRNSLRNHLYFIYPDGSMDNSWGIRSNKWTTYGGVTSDGCQVLFSLYSTEDPRCVTAAVQNLRYLKKSIRDGLVEYGPHHREIFDTPPCIYPTFTKVKNIAFAYELEREGELSASPLPTERESFLKTFPTLDVSLVRTKNFVATVTAYRYKDLAGRSRSKYMYRPSGGAVSLLWVKGHGYLQASSVTEYGRPEPMTFPEAPGAGCLTPRIEYRDSTGYFTNLFDFDSRMEARGDSSDVGRYGIDVEGELRDREWLSGGVGFRMEYRFAGESIEKTVSLIYHDARPRITIVEPVIDNPGMTFTRIDDTTIAISSGGKQFEFHLENGAAVLSLGTESNDYWAPFPALRARPISLIIQPPADGFRQEVRYRLLVKNPE